MKTASTYRFIPQGIMLLALTTAISSCAVGPDYKQPELSLPSRWFTSAPQKSVTDEKAEVEQQWWHQFNDPVLDELIQKADAGNLDLKIAEARIGEARALRTASVAALLPAVNTTGSGERQANRIAFPGFSLTKPFNTFQAGFDASWELDLFGGKRRALEASSADRDAAIASRDEARVSLLAEVARNYVEIRQYQSQLTITRETIDAEEHTVSIVNERFRTGNTSELDLTQARAQLEQFKTQIPYYENLQAQAEYSLDVLLGEQPGATHAIVEAEKPVPVAPKEIVLAAPAKVIANRPDIRMAERQLASATAKQGVAVAELFPDISLSGFLGVLNTNSNQLLQAGSKSWSVGGNVLWPILNYGRISADIDVADARQKEALISYQKSVISALSDVAKTVTAYDKQEEFRQALSKTVKDNRETTSIARMRYKEGLSSFIDVLDAQRTLYASESQLVQANAEASANFIATYKSLGGGWAGSTPKQ